MSRPHVHIRMRLTPPPCPECPGLCWAWREGGWRCIRPDDGHEHDFSDEPAAIHASLMDAMTRIANSKAGESDEYKRGWIDALGAVSDELAGTNRP